MTPEKDGAMIIMPGQSVRIGVQMVRQPDGSFRGKRLEHDQAEVDDSAQGEIVGRFVEVPPPAAAPVQVRAKELGLLDGLRVEPARHDQWRCAECHAMQSSGAEQVWVPDGVERGMSAQAVTEMARLGAFNGGASAWCVPCARTIGKRHQIRKDIASGLVNILARLGRR